MGAKPAWKCWVDFTTTIFLAAGSSPKAVKASGWKTWVRTGVEHKVEAALRPHPHRIADPVAGHAEGLGGAGDDTLDADRKVHRVT